MARVSIIINTRNRARDLEQTLVALGRLEVPADLETELLVVDNGSADHTPAVVQNCALPALHVRYVREEQPGLSHARNAGLHQSSGEVILFTDDDVRPPAGWLMEMSAPLLSKCADAIVGGVRLAPSLHPKRLGLFERSWLADTCVLEAGRSVYLTGANFGFHRCVLDKVPAFDPELGAGALGFCEDTLFSLQLREAGYRFASAFETVIEHCPAPERALPASMEVRADKGGQAQAYLFHHWFHSTSGEVSQFCLKQFLCLAYLHLRLRGCSLSTLPRETRLVHRFCASTLHHFWALRNCPRHYTRHGLIKLPTDAQYSSPAPYVTGA